MDERKLEEWIGEILPKYQRLTASVVSIMESLIRARRIEFLAVTGRTKDAAGIAKKIKRKGYSNPVEQLTDISGIRIVVFFESDVARVNQIIAEAFNVHREHSLNKDDLLSPDQIGYRSVHTVCDIGDNRAQLPEFDGLPGLRFEFQIRTVLQHAWAELAHDRNYKFTGRLPKQLERKLYLYAGMLEVADRGFDEVSQEIDLYKEALNDKTHRGDLSSEINAVSLVSFVENWCAENRFVCSYGGRQNSMNELLDELSSYGVHTLQQLSEIIPRGFASAARSSGDRYSIYGLVRDWMITHDWQRFADQVSHEWLMEESSVYDKFIPEEELQNFYAAFEWIPGWALGDNGEYEEEDPPTLSN
ncbi:MAG: GTP pyrophosphokinase [Pseudomonadales bacterium]